MRRPPEISPIKDDKQEDPLARISLWIDQHVFTLRTSITLLFVASAIICIKKKDRHIRTTDDIPSHFFKKSKSMSGYVVTVIWEKNNYPFPEEISSLHLLQPIFLVYHISFLRRLLSIWSFLPRRDIVEEDCIKVTMPGIFVSQLETHIVDRLVDRRIRIQFLGRSSNKQLLGLVFNKYFSFPYQSLSYYLLRKGQAAFYPLDNQGICKNNWKNYNENCKRYQKQAQFYQHGIWRKKFKESKIKLLYTVVRQFLFRKK